MSSNQPQIVSVATALPPHKTKQKTVANFARSHFKETFKNENWIQKIFDNVQVDTRYFSSPVDVASRDASFPEKNKLYVETACQLGKSAIEQCLNSLPKSVTQEIKHFIYVSSTGISTPTIDAILLNQLQIPKNVKRTPIWGLGCLGGIAGLSRAADFLSSSKSGYVLLLSVELCSLTFQNRDLSKSNLIATSLFGDGAAAALIGYPNFKLQYKMPKILATISITWPHSLDVMGWKIVDTGMEVIFSKDIPNLVRSWLKETIEEFLSKEGLNISQIHHFITHPGGAKVLSALKETFQLPEHKISHPVNALKNYGNISSSSVLFVLKSILENGNTQSGEYGLVSALGPGFSAELMLVQWN